MKKRILLLGATGSIGSQTMDIVRQFPETFSLQGIAGGKKKKEMELLQNNYQLKDEQVFIATQENISIQEFIRSNPADIYVNAISGVAGIEASEEIIQQENPLCLANKESLVARGETIMNTKKCDIIPVDSEHSSMAHLLSKVRHQDVKKIWLTASGGPFRNGKKYPLSKFTSLTASQALKHPTWSMGAKISIDSATLMNKAFELIEAVRLFDFPVETYQVVIHPQSIIHAAVETKDGNIIFEGSNPSMHLPIARALFSAIGQSVPAEFSLPEFSPFGQNLSFEAVDSSRFPSLTIAKKALEKGEKACRQMLQENDESVELFLNGKITFSDIFQRVERSIE